MVEYNYDARGRIIGRTGSLVSTLGWLNPFRYRGYVYDEETRMYYLRSRYYNPEWGRFINADEILGQTGEVLSHNLFAYCANNPIVRCDSAGNIFETVFDIVSLGISIVEVSVNPTNIEAWVGLVGDLIDLVPGLTGIGEIARGIRVMDKVVETTDNVVDATRILRKTDNLKAPYGFYEITFENGYKYVGEGPLYRATVSAKNHAVDFRLGDMRFNSPPVSIRWASAPDRKSAYMLEYLLQDQGYKTFSHIKNNELDMTVYKTYNKIWSPGKGYYNAP